MKRLWHILNSPLIVATISIALVLGLTRFGIQSLFTGLRGDEQRQDQVEALGRLELLSFSTAKTPSNVPQKYVGRIRNHSQFILHNIRGTICFYDQEGELIDVISQELSGVGHVPPNATREFYIQRQTHGDGALDEQADLNTLKMKITFVDLDVTEAQATANNSNADSPNQQSAGWDDEWNDIPASTNDNIEPAPAGDVLKAAPEE